MKPGSVNQRTAMWLLCGCTASVLHAQTMEGADPTEPFEARQGGAVRLSASTNANVAGEDRRGLRLMPSVEYHWDNGWMVGTDRGVAYNFSRDPRLQYGLGLGVDMGRQASDKGALAGMGSIDAKPEVAAFLSHEFAKDWRITSSLRHGSGNDRQGAVAELGLNHNLSLAPDWRLGLSASTKWANSAYMQTYYGVTSSQAASSGHAVSTPSGGLTEWGAGVHLNHQLTRRISVMGGINASSLRGEARNSSVVTKPDSVMGQLSVNHSF
jgi:outer membrane protein